MPRQQHAQKMKICTKWWHDVVLLLLLLLIIIIGRIVMSSQWCV